MKTRVHYAKNERGYEFPTYDGELLSWDIGLYVTPGEQGHNYPRARVVIQAMAERRPEQLARQQRDALRGSFDRLFGRHAKRMLDLIDEVVEQAS